MSGFGIEGISGGPFGTNAYLVVDNATKKCAIIDPGYDADKIWGEVLEQNGLELESIILTHGHIDHVTGVASLHKAFPEIPILIHIDDAPQLTDTNIAAASMLGLPTYEPVEPTGYIEEGQPISVGETNFEVFHVPGHSPGHVALFNDKKLISGDVIFAGSIGRTDLPGGDYHVLANSIVDKLIPLGDDVVVYPGHGPVTTIGQECMTNPFIREMLNHK